MQVCLAWIHADIPSLLELLFLLLDGRPPAPRTCALGACVSMPRSLCGPCSRWHIARTAVRVPGAGGGHRTAGGGRAPAAPPVPRSFYKAYVTRRWWGAVMTLAHFVARPGVHRYGKPVSRIINRTSCYFWGDERDKAQEKGSEVVGRRLRLYIKDVNAFVVGRVRGLAAPALQCVVAHPRPVSFPALNPRLSCTTRKPIFTWCTTLAASGAGKTCATPAAARTGWMFPSGSWTVTAAWSSPARTLGSASA